MNSSQRWLKQQDKQQEQERVEVEARSKPAFFDTFDDYVKAFPEGEHQGFRRMAEKGCLIATYEGQSCLEGDYYLVHIYEWRAYGNKPDGRVDYRARTGEIIAEVVVNDGDDGYARKRVANRQEAEQEVENLKMLAPFYYGTLVSDFGYRND